MDFSWAVYDYKEGLMYLNDRAGSLYLYDLERVRKIYNSRHRLNVWTPYVRRSITIRNDRILYSDGRNTFIVNGADLLPVDLPPGVILEPGMICDQDKYYVIDGESSSVPGIITSCKRLEEPAVAYINNTVATLIYSDKEINIRNDLISAISEERIGTLKGRLLNFDTFSKLEVVGSVRQIVEDDLMYVVTRRNGRSLIILLDGDEITDRIALNGRFNGLIKLDDSLIVYGERIEIVEV